MGDLEKIISLLEEELDREHSTSNDRRLMLMRMRSGSGRVTKRNAKEKLQVEEKHQAEIDHLVKNTIRIFSHFLTLCDR